MAIYVVADAGTIAANGQYVEDGVYGSYDIRPKYRLGSTSYYIWFDDNMFYQWLG